MNDYVDFEKIVELSDRYGAKLIRVSGPWHVFSKDGTILLIPVRNGKVYVGYFQRFKRWLEEKE